MSVESVAASDVAPYRPFRVHLARRHRLGASLLRLTLAGDDLHLLGSRGCDQRVKLVLPVAGRGVESSLLGLDWLERWRAMPVHGRPAVRTYTMRRARPALREVDIDVVVHGATGPASAWAERARPGEDVVLIGPDARFDGDCGGVEWRPPGEQCRLLLAGDESALPAICSIVEQLPDGACGHVVVEVPEEGDVLTVSCPAGVTMTWLPRRGVRHGRLLAESVLEVAPGLLDTGAPTAPGEAVSASEPGDDLLWEVPAQPAPSQCYAWLAGEAGVVTHLRRCLVRDLGVDRRSVAFMGYWRQGRASPS